VNTSAISISIKVQQHIVKKYDVCILTRQKAIRIEGCVELTSEPGVCLNETVTVASKQLGRETQRNSMFTAYLNPLY